MATPTNTQIWTELIKLRNDLGDQGHTISDLTNDVGELRKRMDAYDKQASENNQLLKEMKPALFFVKNSVRAFKWAAALVVAGTMYQIGTYVFHLFVH